MGTIEDGIEVRRSWGERLLRRLKRFTPLLLLLAGFLAVGLFLKFSYTPLGSVVPEKNVTLETKIEVNPRASGELRLARIEVSIINRAASPIFSTLLSVSIGNSSNSAVLNLPAGADDGGRFNGRRASAEFYLCDAKRYAEVLNVSFLRQDALEKCIVYSSGSDGLLKVELSKGGVPLAFDEKRLE